MDAPEDSLAEGLVEKSDRASEGKVRGGLKEKSRILGNLDKATPIELFFDLVFIVCMRSLTPVLSEVSGDVVGWYECYTFVFCFILMMQVWFSATMLMNRCGTGGMRDVRFLLVTMFLLFLMTRIISTGWEHYIAFNLLWCLLNVNLILNWRDRLKSMPKDVREANKSYIVRIGVAHLTQIVLVLVSFLFPSVPAQVCCLIALMAGFISWPVSAPLSEAGREHLAERCALFIILAFGETLVGLSSMMSETLDESGDFGAVIYYTAVFFLMISGLFLIYLVEFEKKLDLSRLGGGSRYMVLTTFLVFCVVNITASFEMSIEGKSLWFMSSSTYFLLAACVFMLSFFLFKPFNRPPVRKGIKWSIARFVICILPCILEFIVEAAVPYMNDDMNFLMMLLILLTALASLGMVTIGSFVVFAIDYKMYTPKREKKKKLKGKQENGRVEGETHE